MATKAFLQELLKIPTLSVLGYEYHIVFCPKKWRLTDTPGTVNFALSYIYIDTTVSNQVLLDVLLHEVFEIIKDRYTLNTLDHQAICCLEFGIADFFRTNSKFTRLYAKYLTNSDGNNYDEKDFRTEKELENLPYEEKITIEANNEEAINEISGKKKKKKKKSRGKRKK